MNQTILQKLKRVKLHDFTAVFIFLAAIPISFFYKRKHRHLWIFSDSPNEARDNGYWLFKYIRENHPNQESVFTLKKTSPDKTKVQALGQVIDYGSFIHWICYLAAENIISSHKASGPNSAVCYVLERFNLIKGNKIFLQHGIIKDNITFLYYKYTHIRLFSCCTIKELQYVRQHYGYPQENVQLLGLCRFDYLFSVKTSNRKIVIMPTWRKWLSLPTKGIINEKQLESLFLESTYYKKWLNLINNSIFIKILEQNNLSCIFYLHRESQKYSHFFNSKSERIVIGEFPLYDVQQLLKESEILITDYSSVAMDFAYMDKPLIYYQFDYNEFRKGHLEEGYFNYEQDGFGPVCYTDIELMNVLLNFEKVILENNFKFQERRNNFFTLKDNKNCQRAYEAINNISRNGNYENT